MSTWGLTYKGVEILTPAEWNRLIDALNDLDNRVVGGLANFTGDGTTTTYQIPHGLGTNPVSIAVSKGAPNLPDIDHITADSINIQVVFKTPPAAGSNIQLWWIALKPKAPVS